MKLGWLVSAKLFANFIMTLPIMNLQFASYDAPNWRFASYDSPN